MPAVHNYTVEEVRTLFTETVVDTFAGSPEGQAQLNRIAKSITNESLIKRVKSQRETHAEIAFNARLADVVAKTPDSVAQFVAGKANWIARHIAAKYGDSEA
ncbi:hypothetical protein KP003_06870 [Geomonas nitrogeniifigens]|uniref:hypothetical protein n=1 Tax=Geomonas diazotrophica TaxID=2843197 RepID=UPI001C2BEFCC|nr:hypothetical protein [Geomonas nitrogeniifigens]QXE88114.1 hypothetical protein KP003_06870 [Geomonas nitrogeniifigens]